MKIPANSPHPLKPGDHICFGVAVESSAHEFDYTFHMCNEIHGHCSLQQRQNMSDCEVARKRKLDNEMGKLLQESVLKIRSEQGRVL